jgi:hypothetical protein
MNFHENCPAGSEDSVMIQYYRVLTVVMFCVHFFFIGRKQGKKSTLIRSVLLTHVTLILAYLKDWDKLLFTQLYWKL